MASENNSPKENELDYFKRFLITMSFLAAYMGGSIAYENTNNLRQDKREIYNLSEKSSRLSRKIDELNHYIPMMKEPFKSQCNDTLLTLAGDAIMTDAERFKLENKVSDINKKSCYSWAAFFMKD